MVIIAIVKRIVLQTIRDKRTLALILVAPLILLTLVNFLLTSNNTSALQVGVYGTSDSFNEELKANDIEVINYTNNNEVKKKIIGDNLKAFISKDNEKMYVTYENSNPADSTKIKAKVQGALAKLNSNALLEVVQKVNKNQPNLQSNAAVENIYIYGDENLSFFDTLNPILIGFFVFFFVFLISGISLLKERTTKTLEKLLATSIKRSEIIVGYLLGYGIFAVLQTIVIVLYSIYVLNIRMSGSIFLMILTNIVIALSALSLGLLLSTFANSEFQMMQFIPLVVVPQIFFAGIIPVENMAKWLQNIAHVMPLYYGAQVLQGIMIKSYGFKDIKFNLSILLFFIVIFYILNILGLKRYRKI